MAKSIFCGRETDMACLRREWREATVADGQPQVVVLLADNGLGKTRLVQEFFGWLSTGLDAPGDAGYWPDELEATGDNLRVNPPLSQCRPEHPPPFLWWGLRFTEVDKRNSAVAGMDEALPDLAVHLDVLLAGVRDHDRRRRALEALGDAGLDFTLEVADTLKGGGMIKAGANLLRKFWGIGREYFADRAPPALDELRQREHASKAARVVESIGHVLTARDSRMPLCVFADDAHFSDPDPDTVDLLRRLLDAARKDRWPLLLIVTHWQDRWNNDASAIARWLKPQSDRIILHSFDKLLAPALAPVLAQRYPRLPPAQANAILARADGNPQFLDEIILFMDDNVGLFADADRSAGLTQAGLDEVMRESVERHKLNARRFRDLPHPARSALAIGSLQGPRMLQDLTAEICAAIGLGDHAAFLDGIAFAEMPHNLVKREGLWAEFLQRLYREIAEQDVRNIHPDRNAVQTSIIAALRRRLTDPETLAGLPVEDRLATLSLAWTVMRAAPDDADATLGAIAAAMLIAERFERREYLGAGAQAQDRVDAMRARMAH